MHGVREMHPNGRFPVSHRGGRVGWGLGLAGPEEAVGSVGRAFRTLVIVWHSRCCRMRRVGLHIGTEVPEYIAANMKEWRNRGNLSKGFHSTLRTHYSEHVKRGWSSWCNSRLGALNPAGL